MTVFLDDLKEIYANGTQLKEVYSNDGRLIWRMYEGWRRTVPTNGALAISVVSTSDGIYQYAEFSNRSMLYKYDFEANLIWENNLGIKPVEDSFYDSYPQVTIKCGFQGDMRLYGSGGTYNKLAIRCSGQNKIVFYDFEGSKTDELIISNNSYFACNQNGVVFTAEINSNSRLTLYRNFNFNSQNLLSGNKRVYSTVDMFGGRSVFAKEESIDNELTANYFNNAEISRTTELERHYTQFGSYFTRVDQRYYYVIQNKKINAYDSNDKLVSTTNFNNSYNIKEYRAHNNRQYALSQSDIVINGKQKINLSSNVDSERHFQFDNNKFVAIGVPGELFCLRIGDELEYEDLG